jgi:hypothetical protein
MSNYEPREVKRHASKMHLGYARGVVNQCLKIKLGKGDHGSIVRNVRDTGVETVLLIGRTDMR